MLNQGFNVTSLDIVNRNKTNVKLALYDGKKIPFPDNTFDIVIVSFVLIFIPKNIEEIVKELARVSRNYVLVLEDTPQTKLQVFFKKLWRLICSPTHPFVLFSRTKWIKIFEASGLSIKEIKDIKVKIYITPVYNLPQSIFYLKKKIKITDII